MILRGNPLTNPLNIRGLYEKIGSFGKLFSDDRLVDIFSLETPLDEVVVDCPLSLPPCMYCTQQCCPGVLNCENLEVAQILVLSEQLRTRHRKRKKRPVNPQSQRVWDIWYQLESPNNPRLEPAFSANVAPLVARARTLEKRLKSLDSPIELTETFVPGGLKVLCEHLGLPNDYALNYKKFEIGLNCRSEIFEKLTDQGWISSSIAEEHRESLLRSSETFQAFVSAFISSLRLVGLCKQKPEFLADETNFVLLPEFSKCLEDDSGKIERVSGIINH